ncbi:MAG: hypothetical protein R3A52_22240 [Polyangiales bacterium]
MQRPTDRAAAAQELRRRLRVLFEAQSRGGLRDGLDRARRDADSYSDALVRDGSFTAREVLAMVGEERALAAGPATRRVGFDGLERGSA